MVVPKRWGSIGVPAGWAGKVGGTLLPSGYLAGGEHSTIIYESPQPDKKHQTFSISSALFLSQSG